MVGYRAAFRVLVGLLPVWSGPLSGSQEGALEEGMVNPGYQDAPAWFSHSFLDIREDLADATAEGRRLMLYFYQDGCPYCKKLMQDNFGQAAIAAKTRESFDVVAINMWGDRGVTGLKGEDTTEKGFAKSVKVMFTPTLVMLDENGGVALRINGYFPPHRFDAALDYVGGRHEKELTFAEYAATVSPVPASGDLRTDASWLKPPYRFAEGMRASGKPLLVLFEQKQCRACDELHGEILSREDSMALLSKFDLAVLDRWSNEAVQTPDGRDTTAKDWARALDVKYAPALVFFGTDGKEAIRADAYLRTFHIQSLMDYVASGAYRDQSEFQRFIASRADALREQGIEVDLME
ncbi:MAG: thioredoxin fold domain-containing protein [Pseudomonadota bacterium]|nr:thioredoxin fold domain-containing protein [Pseudomonadota bacterium]